MKKIFVLFMFLGALLSWADSTTLVQKYRLYGVSALQENVSYLSPLYYGGVGLHLTAMRYKHKSSGIKTIYSEYNFSQYSYDYLKMYEFDYSFLLNRTYRIPLPMDSSKMCISNYYIGWGYWSHSKSTNKLDNGNNPSYFYFNNMATLAVQAHYKLGKRWQVMSEHNLPLWGLYMGSEYGFGVPYFMVEKDAKFKDALHVFGIGRNVEYNHKLSVDYAFSYRKKPKTLRFQWEWSIQKLHLNNNLVHANSHTFKLGYLLNR